VAKVVKVPLSKPVASIRAALKAKIRSKQKVRRVEAEIVDDSPLPKKTNFLTATPTEAGHFYNQIFAIAEPLRWIEERYGLWLQKLEKQAMDFEANGDTENAARIMFWLVKLSPANRQRIDVSGSLSLSKIPDLSALSDAELNAVELGDPATLDLLASKIGRKEDLN